MREIRLHIRYAGTDNALEIALGRIDEMREAFETEHRSRYGFVVTGRELVAEAMTVEGIGLMEAASETSHAADPMRSQPPVEATHNLIHHLSAASAAGSPLKRRSIEENISNQAISSRVRPLSRMRPRPSWWSPTGALR